MLHYDNWITASSEYLPSYTLASEISLTAAASTMFLITNFLMALSFGTHLAQLVHLTGWTWPRPFLFLPLLRLFDVWNKYGIDFNTLFQSEYELWYFTNNKQHIYYNWQHDSFKAFSKM